MLVEFSLYNVNTNLLAVFSFLLEFPVSDRAVPSMDLRVVPLWPFRGLDLQLLLTVPRCDTADGVPLCLLASFIHFFSSRSSSSPWFSISWCQASRAC